MIIGFQPEGSILNLLLAFILTILFGFAFSWISATIGLVIREVETVQVAGFIWMFPLVFASSIFVPIETMPEWLAAFAKVNPITVTVNAVRALVLGGKVENNISYSLIWTVVILAIFIPLAVIIYRRRT